MKEQDILNNIAAYETSGKLLTHPHVPCTCCNSNTTMFGNKPGDNLAKRIAKYGSLRNLLSEFKCRACSKGEPVTSAPVLKVKKPMEAKAPDVAVQVIDDVEYVNDSVKEAAALMSKEDCAKVFVMMPNGKKDYWWRHPDHASQKSKCKMTVTHDGGRKEYIS
jgi:hypothetical protein